MPARRNNLRSLWQMNSGRAIAWNYHDQLATLTSALPFARDRPKDRLVASLHPFNPFHKRWTNREPLWRSFAHVDLDAGKILVEPDLGVAEHEVILRIVWIRI